MGKGLDTARCSLAPKRGVIEESAISTLCRDVGKIGPAGGDRFASTPFAGA